MPFSGCGPGHAAVVPCCFPLHAMRQCFTRTPPNCPNQPMPRSQASTPLALRTGGGCSRRSWTCAWSAPLRALCWTRWLASECPSCCCCTPPNSACTVASTQALGLPQRHRKPSSAAAQRPASRSRGCHMCPTQAARCVLSARLEWRLEAWHTTCKPSTCRPQQRRKKQQNIRPRLQVLPELHHAVAQHAQPPGCRQGAEEAGGCWLWLGWVGLGCFGSATMLT